MKLITKNAPNFNNMMCLIDKLNKRQKENKPTC